VLPVRYARHDILIEELAWVEHGLILGKEPASEKLRRTSKSAKPDRRKAMFASNLPLGSGSL
jgi:hypothetical protein